MFVLKRFKGALRNCLLNLLKYTNAVVILRGIIANG